MPLESRARTPSPAVQPNPRSESGGLKEEELERAKEIAHGVKGFVLGDSLTLVDLTDPFARSIVHDVLSDLQQDI